MFVLVCLVISFLRAMVLHRLSFLVVKCFIKGVSMQHLFGNHNKIEMAMLVVLRGDSCNQKIITMMNA